MAEGNRAHLKEELGDLLFIVANLCRWLNFEAEEVAHAAAKKFIHRFQTMEAVAEQQGKSLDEATLDDWLAWWKEAKEK